MRSHRNSDCSINVGGQTFNCHRLVIELVSSHIRKLLERAGDRATSVDLDLPEVTPRAFEHVVRFAYRGCVELDANAISDVMAAADALSIPRLRADCVTYMTNTVGPDNCLRYWTYLESYDVAVDAEQGLYRRCREVARSTFCRSIHSLRPLAGANDAVIDMLLRDDALQVCIYRYTGLRSL